MKRCENCGVFDDVIFNKGVDVEITRRAENKFKRDSHVTVWCCSSACALQSQARARYGEASYKWPISLAKFAGVLKSAVTRAKKA